MCTGAIYWARVDRVVFGRAGSDDARWQGYRHGLTLAEAVHLGLPTWAARGVRPKRHRSSPDAAKQPGAHAYLVEVEDWQRLVEALDGRDADVMVEAKGKELALVPLGIAIEPPADPATPPTTDAAGTDPPAQDSGNRGV